MSEMETVAEDVRIPKGWLVSLVIALVLSLLVVAYLLGRQSVEQPVAQPTPAVDRASVVVGGTKAVETSEQSLSARLDRIESRVDRTSVRLQTTDRSPTMAAPESSDPLPPTGEPEAVRQPEPTKTERSPEAVSSEPPLPERVPDPEAEKKRAYFRQVDAILQNTAAMDDPNQFATKFLQQAMSGDTSGFNSLLTTTRQAKTSLQSVTPPPSCKEHHTRLLSQLSQSVALLDDVYQAIQSNDTSKLSSVAARGQSMQAETEKFKQLDRSLRGDL